MTHAEAMDEYIKAQKMGQRDYREKILRGQSPYLPVLDNILQGAAGVDSQMPLGLVDIPMDLLVGTKTEGRTGAFASNFMPLLDMKSEFGAKWISLCIAHVEEGIRDPIRCYEYLGRFYVQEGNKRVSVLKYFGASSVPGVVTRILPPYSDDPEIQRYYEFVQYFPITKTYLLQFTKPGSFARLQKILGKQPDEIWSEEDRVEMLSLYNWVGKAFAAHGGDRLHCTLGDVLLLLLRVYPKKELQDSTPAQLNEKLDALPGDRAQGCLFHHPVSTGLVQEAYDGQTARGLWYCISQETLRQTETEADARWYMEKLAIDFLKEDGQWKIWHVVVATDLQSEAGANYMEQKVDLPDAENAAFVEFGTPNLPMRTHNERYNWLDNYPAPPVPYKTFDEDNSYGPEGHPDYVEV